MRKFITTAFVAMMLLVGELVFAADVNIGIQIGPPPPPRVVFVAPSRPAPEFVWIDGYWFAEKNHYRWHQGYWTRPPYPGAHWVAPRHDGRMFFVGYWEGERGKSEHNHHWDHDRDRDFRHDDHHR